MTNTLVDIGRAYGASDFSLLRAGFEAAGIPLFVNGDHSLQIRSDLALAMGGGRLMVFEDDFEEAAHLLPELIPEHSIDFSFGLRIFLFVLCFGFAVPFHFMGTFARYRVVGPEINKPM